jgi:hypothetical protein
MALQRIHNASTVLLVVFFFSVSYLGVPLRLELCSASSGPQCMCGADCCSAGPTPSSHGAALTGPKCCAFLQALNSRADEFVSAKAGTIEISRGTDATPACGAAVIPAVTSACRVPHPVARSGVLDVDIPLLVSSLRI